MRFPGEGFDKERETADVGVGKVSPRAYHIFGSAGTTSSRKRGVPYFWVAQAQQGHASVPYFWVSHTKESPAKSRWLSVAKELDYKVKSSKNMLAVGRQ